PRVAYDHRQQRDTFMTPRPDDPLHTIPHFALQDGRRLAFSAGLNIVCVGGALAVGAVLLTRIMPAGGYAYFYKTLGAYLLILLPLLGFLHAHRPHTRFGPANTVTLIRAAMVCLLASLCGERWYDIRLPIVYGERWNTFELLVAGVAILALTLDGVDGWLARLRGTQSRFGARFDMETDALLVLVLSVLAWQSGRAGAWVMIAGSMRYGFIVLTLLRPWLNRPLPESMRRKTVCVLQLIALIACVAPILPDAWRAAAAVGAVVMVTASFAIDLDWLIRQRRSPLPQAPNAAC
ncbi:MAG TPA: CDP-alcohol phosphatidyltransferase family protein, partial [Lautropia sp.]|nr:CDP-alcohol phosphatidyltransferase family protein [Lautropia sp.]